MIITDTWHKCYCPNFQDFHRRNSNPGYTVLGILHIKVCFVAKCAGPVLESTDQEDKLVIWALQPWNGMKNIYKNSDTVSQVKQHLSVSVECLPLVPQFAEFLPCTLTVQTWKIQDLDMFTRFCNTFLLPQQKVQVGSTQQPLDGPRGQGFSGNLLES